MAASQPILGFIKGLTDNEPLQPVKDVDQLQDPFANLVLKPVPPAERKKNLTDLTEQVTKATGDGFEFLTFLVGDGGQVPTGLTASSAVPGYRYF